MSDNIKVLMDEINEKVQEKTKEQLFEEKVNNFVLEKNPKVVILTPCYGGLCHINYVHALITTINLFQYFKIPLHVEFCKNDSLIPRARNNLVAKSLFDEKMTHFIFIDADIQWNPIDIIKLLIADKCIIGGAYPLRSYNWSKILPDQNGDPNQNKVKAMIDRKNNSVLKNIMNDESMIRSNLLEYNINYAEKENNIVQNLIKVKHLATGFLVIKREVFEKMMIAYPSTKYHDDIKFLTEEENKYAYAFFDCGVEEGHYFSEDWMFCSRWTKMGGSIWLDVSINLTHIGNENFVGSYISSII
jgi:hypothetical protein